MRYTFVIISRSLNNNALSGKLLQIFLSEFLASGEVLLISEDEFCRLKENIKTEYLFLSVPSGLSIERLLGVSYKKLIAFDYYDEADRNIDLIDVATRGLFSGYFKTTFDGKQDYTGLAMGLLPINIPPTLGSLSSMVSRLTNIRRKYDVSFIGTTTYLKKIDYNQRLEWVKAIKDENRFKYWGGLLELPYNTKAMQEKKYSQRLDHYFCAGVDAKTYIKYLKKSRIVLCPAGHARWSYRLFEAIYADALPIATDLSNTRILLDLPLDTIYMVKDGENIVEHIDNVLSKWKEYKSWIPENHAFMEKQLFRGKYSSKKPAIYEKFLAQIENI